MTRESGVYRIYNTVNSHIYVGSSACIEERWKQHKRLLRKGIHDNSHLQRAWNKYGEQAFEFSILEIVDINMLADMEQIYIDNLHPEYNIALSVKSSMLGRKHKNTTKSLMSKNRLGDKNSFWGKKHTEESKRKMSEWRAGRKFGLHSNETKIKMSNSSKGDKNGFYGKKHSKESLDKISKASKERVFSQDTRKKLSERHRGENHYSTKLTDSCVREIRELWKSGNYSQIEIGNIFGVNNKIINNVVNYRTWRHI